MLVDSNTIRICAGGTKAHIAVMTAATGFPKEVEDEYITIFERLGTENVEVIHTEHRDESECKKAIRQIEEATGIFFTGGDQSRIVDFIKGSPLGDAIHKCHAEGGSLEAPVPEPP
ncbi:Type 1 glutamine amidotransferase-like domain-containing protein [Leptodesmis sp.]|uniref:Type 1 glutamine amidotransferase-like domain-containing protein n=1 Tax=Leptodesmis sp. TaxID=3100501 RepID=UPI0040534B9C